MWFEAQYTIATNEFEAVSCCDAALQSSDTGILCSATCRSLLEGVLNSCPTVSGDKLYYTYVTLALDKQYLF